MPFIHANIFNATDPINMSINHPPRNPTLLVILDGFGISNSKINNPITQANTPILDRYFSNFPNSQLEASGAAVALPEGQMGNSEVGHLTLGAGATVPQYLVSIDDAIKDRSFFDKKTLVTAIKQAKKSRRPIHLIGLVSDGGVHSHNRHLYALIELCHRHGVRPLLHMITDGRDTAPHSAQNYTKELSAALTEANGSVATVCGRYYAMDRDQRWERTELAWRAIVLNQARTGHTLETVISNAYQNGESDEFIKPTVLPSATPIAMNDEVIFFNYRKDRTKQLTTALATEHFNYFDRGNHTAVSVTCMTNYVPELKLPYAFNQQKPKTTLAETISHAGLSQFHCAETEKYAHITYFFNGGRKERYEKEERCIVPSPKVSTYDHAPSMSAAQITDEVIHAMEKQHPSFIVVNFANGDMLGHTAVRDAVIQAIETLDREAGRLLDAAVLANYSIVLTADHGNCEQLIDPDTGKPHTQHTLNPVPCLIIDPDRWKLESGGSLKDIAPTVLQLMGLDIPSEMTGHSLLIKETEEAPTFIPERLPSETTAVD